MSITITGIEADCAGFRKLDGIGQQVVYDLCDTVHITEKSYTGIIELMVKQDAFVVYYMGETGNGTLQQVIQVERDIVPCFLGLVQTIYIQQIVKQVSNMSAYYPYVVQMVIPMLFITCIHGQFSTAANDIQRGTNIM